MVRRFLLALALVSGAAPLAGAASPAGYSKLDEELRNRAQTPLGHSRVILSMNSVASADTAIRAVRGTVGRRLGILQAQVADVPDGALEDLASQPGVRSVSIDRAVYGTMERTGATIGSTWVHDTLGYDGTGIGVAIVDSGVVSWHDDLGPNRVEKFVDFVNFQPIAYDDYGHGTHVAGIVAGSGHDSGGRRRGIAPGASLVVLKVLDAGGQGYISNVIAAIDYAIANRDTYHIRILNLSVAAGVYESYNTDPLTLAARRAVESGIVVVSAAGNFGKNDLGQPQAGGIGAPGNAPWVITVGASSTMGTVDRGDDTIAGFSSRGPSAIDFSAKPDLVAPGVGIESLTDAGTSLYQAKPSVRLWGTVPTATEPYLALSGTSMAAPVVSGTIALMLQADPALTPNLVKGILQYTAEMRNAVSSLAQGAGFLNARGAVELAKAIGSGSSFTHSQEGDPTLWSGHIIWGNHRIGGGKLEASAAAWRSDVVWGSARTPDGRIVAWGDVCDVADCENIVWGTDCGGVDCKNIVWGASVVCDGLDPACENTLWGTANGGEHTIWGATAACVPADPACANAVRGTGVGVETMVWRSAAARSPTPPLPSAARIRRKAVRDH